MTDKNRIGMSFQRTANFKGGNAAYAEAVIQAANAIAPIGTISPKLSGQLNESGVRPTDVYKAYRAMHTEAFVR